MENNYSPDVEQVLENIRINSILLYKEHQKRYLYYKDVLKYFKVPIIVISSISSIVSVSGQYISQDIISVMNMLLGLLCSIIGSMELFLAISSSMIQELSTSKDYHILAMEISKCLTLDREHRGVDGKTFLEQCFGTYVKLIENSLVVRKKLEDKLCVIPKDVETTSTEDSRDLRENSGEQLV